MELGGIEPHLDRIDDRTHTIWRTVMTGFLVTTFSSWGWCWPPSPLPDRSRLCLRGAYAWEMASRMFSRAALRAGRMAASIPNNPDTSR